MKKFQLCRKVVSAFALAVLISLACYGQADKNFELSLHLGINGSQVQGDGLGGFDKLNLAAGLGVDRDLNEKFSLGLEINFLQKGSRKIADPENNDFVEYKMSLAYAQVPVLLTYNINDKLFGYGGPALGALLSSKESDFNGELTNQPEFEPFDFSAVIGVGYRFSKKWGMELRLDQSLAPIRRKEAGTFRRLISRQYNTSLGVFLSYTIR